MTNEKVSQAVRNLINMFELQQFPRVAKMSIIHKMAGDIDQPSAKWSLNNVILMILNGHTDARGYQQWQQVGRFVMAGEKSFSILGPCTRTITVNVIDSITGDERAEKRQVSTGKFHTIPVFGYDQTDGKPLEKFDYTPPTLPPLYDVARQLGVTVKYAPGNGRFYGRYSPGTGLIHLASEAECVFFHELSHSVSHKLGRLKERDRNTEEIVAEMSALVLCSLYDISGYEKQGFDYCQMYSGHSSELALTKIMQLISAIEEIVMYIIQHDSERSQIPA